MLDGGVISECVSAPDASAAAFLVTPEAVASLPFEHSGFFATRREPPFELRVFCGYHP